MLLKVYVSVLEQDVLNASKNLLDFHFAIKIRENLGEAAIVCRVIGCCYYGRVGGRRRGDDFFAPWNLLLGFHIIHYKYVVSLRVRVHVIALLHREPLLWRMNPSLLSSIVRSFRHMGDEESAGRYSEGL